MNPDPRTANSIHPTPEHDNTAAVLVPQEHPAPMPTTPPNMYVQNVYSQARPGGGLATAGFVLGLLGAISAWIPGVDIISWFLVVPGAIFSAIGIARSANRGLAIAGLVLSVIGLLVLISYLVLVLAVI